MKTIDYLVEDPKIGGQKYALINLIGPHMKAKSDVWGMKIKGFADSKKTADAMTKRFMRVDDNYDVYCVEVGKFFPLDITPEKIGDIRYANEQLNSLVKDYLENRDIAQDEFDSRKTRLIKEAREDNKRQNDLINKKEHPIVVLKRLQDTRDLEKATKERLASLQEDLALLETKYNNYTTEERTQAQDELDNAIKENIEEEFVQKVQDAGNAVSIEDIRNEFMKDTSGDAVHRASASGHSNITSILERLKTLELEIADVKDIIKTVDKESKIYTRLMTELAKLNTTHADLRLKLQTLDNVNAFMNEQYGGAPAYETLERPDPWVQRLNERQAAEAAEKAEAAKKAEADSAAGKIES